MTHLFACNTHLTDLSPKHLWQNPVESIHEFSYLDDRNIECLDNGPDHGKQQQRNSIHAMYIRMWHFN